MTDREQQRPVNHPAGDLVPRRGTDCQRCDNTPPVVGISRQTFDKQPRRYEEQGIEGLQDRPPRPHHSPNATSAEVVGKIVHLRQSYHFGPHEIAMYLNRYHDISMSPSDMWRVPVRLDLSRAPKPPTPQELAEALARLQESSTGAPRPGRRQVHHPD